MKTAVNVFYVLVLLFSAHMAAFIVVSLLEQRGVRVPARVRGLVLLGERRRDPDRRREAR